MTTPKLKKLTDAQRHWLKMTIIQDDRGRVPHGASAKTLDILWGMAYIKKDFFFDQQEREKLFQRRERLVEEAARILALERMDWQRAAVQLNDALRLTDELKRTTWYITAVGREAVQPKTP